MGELQIKSIQQPDRATPAIKFCGLSHASDVKAINSILPEYVGFVFWPESRRYVDRHKAALLRELLDPRIATVGVFVDPDPEDVAKPIEDGIISVAQLHGDEDDAYIERLRIRLSEKAQEDRGRQPVIWKAFEIADEEDVRRANASSADFVLLDGGKGEGRTFPWRLLAGIDRPYGLAGGLNPDNVKDAFSEEAGPARIPTLMDVSSAIESECADSGTPHKDAVLMEEFARGVRSIGCRTS